MIQLIRLHNRELSTRPSVVVEDRSPPEKLRITATKGRSRPLRSCTDVRSVKGHLRHRWKLPPRASATVTCEALRKDEPEPAERLEDKPLVEVGIDPLEEVDEGDDIFVPALVRVAPVVRMSPPGLEPPSQLLEEDTDSASAPSPVLKALLDESTMQFQALGMPSEEPEGLGTLKDLSVASDIAEYDLCTEVSDFLKAPNPEIENCFEFDLGDIIDRCQDEL